MMTQHSSTARLARGGLRFFRRSSWQDGECRNPVNQWSGGNRSRLDHGPASPAPGRTTRSLGWHAALLAGLLALALGATPAHAGGALDSLLLSPPPVSITPIYTGPPYVQSGSAYNGGSAPAAVTLGAPPTVGNVMWEIVYSHTTTPSCLHAATGWILYAGFTTMPQVAIGILYRAVQAGDPATETGFTYSGCGGSTSTAANLWEISGLNTSSPASNVAYSILQDGVNLGITPNFSYVTASNNNFAMFSNADLNCNPSTLSGSPWTHLTNTGTNCVGTSASNAGDYTQVVSGSTFTGTTAGTAQFQAAILVLH